MNVLRFQALQVRLFQQHLDQFGVSARDCPVQGGASDQDGVVPTVDVDVRLAEQQLHDVEVFPAGRVHQPGNSEWASLVCVLTTLQCFPNSLDVAQYAMDPQWHLAHDVAEKGFENDSGPETVFGKMCSHTLGMNVRMGLLVHGSANAYRSHTLNTDEDSLQSTDLGRMSEVCSAYSALFATFFSPPYLMYSSMDTHGSLHLMKARARASLFPKKFTLQIQFCSQFCPSQTPNLDFAQSIRVSGWLEAAYRA